MKCPSVSEVIEAIRDAVSSVARFIGFVRNVEQEVEDLFSEASQTKS